MYRPSRVRAHAGHVLKDRPGAQPMKGLGFHVIEGAERPATKVGVESGLAAVYPRQPD